MRIGARDCWGEDVMGLLKITVLDVWVVYLEYGGHPLVVGNQLECFKFQILTWEMVVYPLKSMVGPAWRSILDTSLILLLKKHMVV